MLDPELEHLLAKLNDPAWLNATLAKIEQGEREMMKQLDAQARWQAIEGPSGPWYADSGLTET